LTEGVDIELAKNCRTSVKMIQKYHAAHFKDLLDTSARQRATPEARKAARRFGRINAVAQPLQLGGK
jgi:hypothetical protein